MSTTRSMPNSRPLNSLQVFSHWHPVAQVCPEPRRVRLVDLSPFPNTNTMPPHY